MRHWKLALSPCFEAELTWERLTPVTGKYSTKTREEVKIWSAGSTWTGALDSAEKSGSCCVGLSTKADSDGSYQTPAWRQVTWTRWRHASNNTHRTRSHYAIKLKEAITHKSAQNPRKHCYCASWPWPLTFDPKINGFLGLIVKHFYVKRGDPSCGSFWDMVRLIRETHTVGVADVMFVWLCIQYGNP